MQLPVITHNDALNSPCATCQKAPCCQLLQLQTVTPKTLSDFDLISYYLNFDHIVTTVSSEMNWTVYYRYPCQFLDLESYHCKIHNTPEQPNICIHYSPYSCYYKKIETIKSSDKGPVMWVNRARMQHLQSYLLFDSDRNVIQLPDRQSLFPVLSELPYEDPEIRTIEADTSFQAWKSAIQSGSMELDVKPEKKSFQEIKNPCQNCLAHCCKYLLFPQDIPRNFKQLDYFKYCLGFPGTYIGVSNQQWVLMVKTACRHLTENNLCSIYGQPERPLICKYYDAGSCTYKASIGQIRPSGFMKIGYEEFNWLLDTYEFDDNGNITFGWDTETLRLKVEEKWR